MRRVHLEFCRCPSPHGSGSAARPRPTMLLIIDNYDSFVFNLARYAEELGFKTRVVRNDAISLAEVRADAPDAILLSPGPKAPDHAGVCLDLVRELGGDIPLLGICLGHQVIGAAFGAQVVRGEPVHGRIGLIHHNGRGVFAGINSPLTAARYHSLVVAPDTVPPELEVTAQLDDGTVMAIRHRELPIVGLQFHPESVLTETGHLLIANFLDDPASQTTIPSRPELAGGVTKRC